MARRLLSSLWLGLFLAGHVSALAGPWLRSEMRQVCNCRSLFCIRPHHHPAPKPTRLQGHCHSSGGQEGVSLEGCPADDEPVMASWFYVLPQPISYSQPAATATLMPAAETQLSQHFTEIDPPPPRTPFT